MGRVRCLVHLAMVFFVLAMSGNAQSPLSPTTTLANETQNNSSASPSFQGMQNGVPVPGNVSKVPISTLLYQGATTRIYAHWMGWFGARDHADVGYRSDDRAQIHRQVEDMVSRGFSGVIAS